MRRLLMFVSAPFSIIGGVVVGYYAHALRNVGDVSADPLSASLLGIGLVLIVVSFFIRKRLIDWYEREIEELRTLSTKLMKQRMDQ